MVERKYVLTFSQQQANNPITFRLVKEYDIEVNILRAEIDEGGGKLIVSITGRMEEIAKALERLKLSGVRLSEMDRFVVRDISLCTDCSMCVSICPVKAYIVDKGTWSVLFEQEKCIGCGLCVDACPPGALGRGGEDTPSL